MRIFRCSFVLFAVVITVYGCFGAFNPDERQYPCEAAQDCIVGYACVLLKPTPTDDMPVPTQNDDMPSEAEPGTDSSMPRLGVCARKCEPQQIGSCPTGFRCAPKNTVDGGMSEIVDGGMSEITVCISVDESDQMSTDMKLPQDMFLTAAIDVGPNPSVDVGSEVSMDIGLPTDPCEGVSCSEPPDAAISDNGCHSACTGYCSFTEAQCQLPCSLNQCVQVCDESDGALVNTIVAQSQLGQANCNPIANGNGNVQSNQPPEDSYGNLGVSCTEFCRDLEAYLIDSVDGVGGVCGSYLDCDQNACVVACESNPAEFGKKFGEITLNQSHERCPLAHKLVAGVNGTNESVSVKDLCIPCEATCSVIFPDDDTSADMVSRFWCGVAQPGSLCPAVGSRTECNAQCELHPEQFFVMTEADICGDLTATGDETVITSRTALCGAQCQSTNKNWGETATLTEDLPTLTPRGLPGVTTTIRVNAGTRLCFRAEGVEPSGDRCDLIIPINGQGYAEFEISLNPIGHEGSQSDLSQNTIKLAAKFTAHGEGVNDERLFTMAVYGGYSDMLLRESIPDPTAPFDSQAYDVVAPVLSDGDISMVSRRIPGGAYTVQFILNDVQTPSALTIDQLTLGLTQDIDSSCQNQCFEKSGGDFCRELCDPERGLMALCAQTLDMPRRAFIPFTSLLSESGSPQTAFCADGALARRPLGEQFDAGSCLQECKRNRCDLQFQINAIWHPGTPSEGGMCHRLNFGGYQGWQIDENLPDMQGERVDHTQLCCLCSHAYCDAILSDGQSEIVCQDRADGP